MANKQQKSGSAKKKPNISLLGAVFIAVAIIIAAVLIITTFKGEFSALLGASQNQNEQNQGGQNYIYPDGFNAENVGLEVHFINVGQGDGIFIKFDNGVNMLIDGGSIGNSSVARNNYMNTLAAQGVSAIDYLIVTHPDSDHIYFLASVLSTYQVKNIYANEVREKDSDTAKALKQTILNEPNAQIEWIGAQSKTFLDIVPNSPNYDVNIYAPGSNLSSDSNDLSLVVVLEYAGRRVLLMGDAETKEEEWFVSTYNGGKTIDVLKISHHGSSTSTQQSFLDFFDAVAFAVISVGENNTYNHPNPFTMNRLFNMGIITYRTNRHGNVVLLVDSAGAFAFRAAKVVPVENNKYLKSDLMILQE
jgi:competence protein ComEC